MILQDQQQKYNQNHNIPWFCKAQSCFIPINPAWSSMIFNNSAGSWIILNDPKGSCNFLQGSLKTLHNPPQSCRILKCLYFNASWKFKEELKVSGILSVLLRSRIVRFQNVKLALVAKTRLGIISCFIC